MTSINTSSIEEVKSCFSKISEKELECKLEERAQYYSDLYSLTEKQNHIPEPYTIQGWTVAPKDTIFSKYIPHTLTVGYCLRENTSRTELCSPFILGYNFCNSLNKNCTRAFWKYEIHLLSFHTMCETAGPLKVMKALSHSLKRRDRPSPAAILCEQIAFEGQIKNMIFSDASFMPQWNTLQILFWTGKLKTAKDITTWGLYLSIHLKKYLYLYAYTFRSPKQLLNYGNTSFERQKC